MPMEIKICGLKRVEDALMVNEFENIKYVGFVFANTPRKITIEKALEIKKNLRFILLSGYTKNNVDEKFLNDIDLFLEKPIRKDVLEKEIKKCLK